MTYRIKVIEYESGRKEYVPQVRKVWGWDDIDIRYSREIEAFEAIRLHNTLNRIKSVTYKPVQP